MADENLLKLLELVKPESDFVLPESPAEPDYSLKDNWAALPELMAINILYLQTHTQLVRKMT